jgi:hypothetical protein
MGLAVKGGYYGKRNFISDNYDFISFRLEPFYYGCPDKNQIFKHKDAK